MAGLGHGLAARPGRFIAMLTYEAADRVVTLVEALLRDD